MDDAIILENNVEIKPGEDNIVTSMWTILYRVNPEQIILLGQGQEQARKEEIKDAIIRHFDDPMLTKIVSMQHNLFTSKKGIEITLIKISNFLNFVLKNKSFLYAILPIILSMVILLHAFFNSNWWHELYN